MYLLKSRLISPSMTSFLIWVLPLLVIGCGCGRVAPPDPEKLLERCDPSYVEGRHAPVRIPRIEVYLDSSEPLRNFIGPDRVPPYTIYTQFLDHLGSNPWDPSPISYFWFGESTRAISKSGHSLSIPGHDRSAYKDNYSRIGEVVRDLVARRRHGDSTVVVVVTDFVQANPEDEAASPSDWPYLANQVREYLKIGDWQLIALRSYYQGTHFSEITGTTFPVPKPVNRPFYVLVFGPSGPMVEAAVTKLLTGEAANSWKGQAKRLRPKSQMMNVRLVNQAIEYTVNAGSETRQRNPMIPQGPLYEHKVCRVIWDGITDRRRPGILRFLVECEDALPGESFMSFEHPAMWADFCCIRWQGFPADSIDFFADSLHVAHADIKLTPPPEQLANPPLYVRQYWLERPLKSTEQMPDGFHYVYRYRLWAEPDSLQLPDWVRGWSTDDDSDPKQIERTLNLRKILDRIVHTTGEDHPLFTGFLIVDGR